MSRFFIRFNSFLIVLFLFVNVSAQQQITVDVFPNITKSIRGISELDRSKFFNLATAPSELSKNLDQERFNRYMNDLGMTVGRKLYVVYTETRWGNGYRQDAARPGFMDTVYFKNQKTTNDNGLEKYMNLWGKNAGVAAHDGHNAYPDFMPKYTPSGSDENMPENADAAAEMAAYTMKYAYSDFQRPEYFELVNEPDWRFWGDQRFIDLHVKTQKKFRQLGVPAEVGGPCFSVGYFYKKDFADMKSIRNFMDATNFGLDFYSFHIYDYMKWNDAQKDFTGRVSSGLPEEAVFDALAAHSFNTYGKEFTYVGSEHGGYVSDKSNLEQAQNALASQYFPGSGFQHEMEKRSISNFIMVNSAIANTLTFMNHPHIVKKAVPFILLESSSWDPYYYSSLMVKENFDKYSTVWHEAKLIHFYEFFKDVRGRYVHSVCNDNDIQQHSFVDGKRLIMVFHNQSNVTGTMKLNLQAPGNAISEIKIRRLGRKVDFRPRFSEEIISDVNNVEIKDQESVAVFITYENTIDERTELDYTPYYSTEAGVQYTGIKEFTVNIPDPETVQAATLRIGLARDAGENKEITVTVNGRPVAMPVEDCASRLTNESEYGSMRSVEIDPAWLRASNKIRVTFKDSNPGGIGAVVIRAARVKSGIPLSANKIRNSSVQMFPNPARQQVTIRSQEKGILEIFSIDGRKLHADNLFQGNNTIALNGFQAGNYIVRMQLPGQVLSKLLSVSR